MLAAGLGTLTDREEEVFAPNLPRPFCYHRVQHVLSQVLENLARPRHVFVTLTDYAEADAAMTFDAVSETVGTIKSTDTPVGADVSLTT